MYSLGVDIDRGHRCCVREAWATLSNLGTEGMAAGIAHCSVADPVPLRSMLHPLEHRRWAGSTCMNGDSN